MSLGRGGGTSTFCAGQQGRYRIQESANGATITDRETGAMVRVLGSDPKRLHGAAPRLLLDQVP
ncbi:MAG: hypothetical protein OYM47_02760 [Gemmatimonadota bacterium]|nr:hypothetical protein [Gemmatimonadota bacterium]